MTELVDIERRLALFAEGIAGRYYHIRTGAQELADTHNLYLPEQIDLFSDGSLNAAAYRLIVLNQLGFHEFGTFDFDIDEARQRIPALGQRDKPSFHRESDLAIFFRHFDQPDLARQLFHALETARIEYRVLARYPGARRYRNALEPYIEPNAFMQSVASYVAGVEALDATVYDTAAGVTHCYEEVVQRFSAEPDPDIEAPDDAPPLEWLQRQVRLEDWQEDLAEMNGSLQAMEFAEEQSDGDKIVGDGDGDGDIREIDQDLVRDRDQLERRIEMERSALRHELGEDKSASRSFLYDEWDYHAQHYLRGWCRLFEEPLIADDKTDSTALLETVRPYARSVRKHFEQIRPAGYQRLGKVPDGDELDLSAIIDARADARVGVSPDERVYSRRERLRRDVGAAFLVDLSASTDDPIVEEEDKPPPRAATEDDGKPYPDMRDPYFDDDDDPHPFHNSSGGPGQEDDRRRIIDVQKEAVMAMSSALEGIGDQYGIYGFSGYGRDCVEYFVAKEFNRGFDKTTLDAIAAMKPKRSTRMGPAIRHTARKLQASGAALKVMIIISDGFPQDCDYGPDRGEHEYGVQDTAKSLEEAERAGIHTFCITVDRSGHDYLRRMCPDDQYMVIEETADLPDALQKAYRRLTQI